MAEGSEDATKQCSSCGAQVAADASYCSECGEPLTVVARYESRPEEQKAAEILLGLSTLLLCIAMRLAPIAAVLGVLFGGWQPVSILYGLLAYVMGYGLEKAYFYVDRVTTPDEVLREKGVIEDGA